MNQPTSDRHPDKPVQPVEIMQATSRAVSTVAIVLMAGGFFAALAAGAAAVPGEPVLALRWPPPEGWSVHRASMSAGIALLGLLPGAQVVMILRLYVARRRLRDALVALVLLIVLAAGMLLGR